MRFYISMYIKLYKSRYSLTLKQETTILLLFFVCCHFLTIYVLKNGFLGLIKKDLNHLNTQVAFIERRHIEMVHIAIIVLKKCIGAKVIHPKYYIDLIFWYTQILNLGLNQGLFLSLFTFFGYDEFQIELKIHEFQIVILFKI